MKEETTVNETALDIHSSPPLTSSLHSRNSASSVQESAYLRQASILRNARLGLSILVSVIGIAIIGCSGHVLHSYNQSHMGSEWLLPLWPVNVDIKPTVGTIVPAAFVTTVGLIYAIFAVVPSPHSRNLYQVYLFLLASVVAFVITLFAVFFNQLLLYRFDANSRDTLQTWTCKFYYGAVDFERDARNLNLQVSGRPLVPAGFERLCKENMASQWMMVALLAAVVLCCGVAFWGVLAEKKIAQARKTRHGGEKCESEFE